MKVYVDCVGCEQRKLDTQLTLDYLKANRIEIVESPLLCDYAIIITCAVDSLNERNSLSKIKDVYYDMPKSSKLFVRGCLPSISPKKLLEYEVSQTFSPRSMETLDFIFSSNLKVHLSDIPYPNRSNFDFTEISGNQREMSPREEYEIAKNNFKIMINQGCLGNCSYCAIKNATGKLQSKPMKEIVEQFKYGVSRGEKTVMLIGGDTGAYGLDIGISFHTLLKELMKIPGEYEIFIHDFNVNWLIKDYANYNKLFGSDRNKLKSVNFPIQSGSDKILTAMRRPYKSEEALQTIKQIKKHQPMKIGTHVMVGFPGETEEDFNLTVNFLEDANFDFISCFPYSEHETTDSAKIPNKIETVAVNRRLSKIAERLGRKAKVHR